MLASPEGLLLAAAEDGDIQQYWNQLLLLSSRTRLQSWGELSNEANMSTCMMMQLSLIFLTCVN
jgi:hypothetical protein